MAASTSPISTYKTFLMHKASGASTYSKLVDIKSTPNLGGTPEMLETTTLSDGIQTFIPGIQTLDGGGLEFTANYILDDYEDLKDLMDAGTEEDFAVWMGASVSSGVATPTGDNGKFEFKGLLSVFPNGGGVNEVVEMTISIAPTTPITLASS